MCGIYILPAGTTMTEDQIENLLARNRDGIGILHVKKLGHQIERYIIPSDETLQNLTRPVRSTRILHARYGTSGRIGVRNIHPFKIDTGYIFHNGIIPGFGNRNECDTVCFLKTLKNADPDTVFTALDQQFASRFVFVPTAGTRLTLFGTGWLRCPNGLLCCGMV